MSHQRQTPPHPGGRQNDTSLFGSAASTLLPSIQQSPAAGDSTIMPGAPAPPFAPPGSAATADFSQLPHSSYATANGQPVEAPPVTPAGPLLGALSSASSTDASSKNPFTEDPFVKETWKLARAKYLEEAIPTGFRPNGSLALEDFDGPDITVSLTTLQQRVNAVRGMRFSGDLVQYEDFEKRFRASLKDEVIALFENAANSLQVVIDLCYSLPWPEMAPQPPAEWVMNCIPEAGETYYSVIDLARAFRYARDWIDSAASAAEVMLILKPAGQYVRPPKKSNSAISKFAQAAATPRILEQLHSRSSSPVQTAPGRQEIQNRRVTIQSPLPQYATPGQAAQALRDAMAPATPASPQLGLGGHITAHYGDISNFLQSAQVNRTLRDGVITANETMPIRADGFAPGNAPTSRGQVSLQLPVATPAMAGQTPGAQSQYATPATVPQFPFNTPVRAPGGEGNLTPITPGQLEASGRPLPHTPYGSAPPPDPFGYYTSGPGFPQPGIFPSASGGGQGPPINMPPLAMPHRKECFHG
ncbi:hypothetical protein AURDEDRAFT_178270 [Auricularia subglabra TFB-10046 SS5]|uniref:Uncharacterized protein n=1 Tax=Auricularia subglabra (strain TFB-10046 / SS5) TaxID=717982 RepID=J0L8G5_AURST|nr:hypothetical protein AURDEDRAFT_178270 [Auricularia subglabra TFB-10046 SS5]